MEDVKDLRVSAAAGDPQAQLRLGEMYYTGIGIEQDHSAAYRWFVKSYEGGMTQARSIIGRMLVWGLGVEKDVRKGLALIVLAAEDGDPAALSTLGRILCGEEEVKSEINYQKAFELFRLSAMR